MGEADKSSHRSHLVQLIPANHTVIMSEAHFDEYEHYNFDQDKSIHSGHSGKQRTKKEAEQNTNRHNPGGHERKIVQKLQNAEAKQKAANGAANGTANSSTADK